MVRRLHIFSICFPSLVIFGTKIRQIVVNRSFFVVTMRQETKNRLSKHNEGKKDSQKHDVSSIFSDVWRRWQYSNLSRGLFERRERFVKSRSKRRTLIRRSVTLIGSDGAALSPMTSLQWWTPMFHSIYLLRSRTTSAVGGVLGVGCWLLAVRASVVIFWARD